MSIRVIGPSDWETIIALNEMLRNVPEEGEFHLGGRHYQATGQLRRFNTAGVPTIEWTDSLRTAQTWVRQGFEVLGRDLYHSRGTDIVDSHHSTWSHKEWWCKFQDSRQEWRFHILDGRCISRDLKLPRPGAMTIRARAFDWAARHDVEPPPEARQAAIRAVAALEGYTHGAVDLLWTSDGPVVLEVNRCPGMDLYTRERWCRAIREYVRVHSTNSTRSTLPRTAPPATVRRVPPPPPATGRRTEAGARYRMVPLFPGASSRFYEGYEII